MTLRISVIAATVAIGGLLFGYNTGVIAGALLFLQVEFHLSAFMSGTVTSIALGGAAVGAVLAGPLADQYGRRYALLGTALLFIAGALASSLAGSILALLSSRFLVGIGIGAASMLVPLYLSEMAPGDQRGRLVSFNQLAMTCGILLSNLVGYAFAATGGWRWMFALGGVPALALAAGMLFLPETPRWLASKGRLSQAQAALQKLFGPDTDITIQILRLKAEYARDEGSPIADGGRAMWLPIIIGVTLAIFQQATGINTVIYFAPVIFQSAGLSSASSAILATACIGVINVATTLFALWLIDRVGRRPLLLTGLFGMGVSLCLLAAGFAFGRSTYLGWFTAASLSAYVGCFAIGLGPVFWLLIAEMFPLETRARGMSAATTVNWVANLVVALTFLSLIQALGRPGAFLLFAFLAFGALIFSNVFVPETKNLSLENIKTLWVKRASVRCPR
jgi:sugar porter (SP) family MFS transporter